ncbi:hypothetical protein CLOP_g20204 [Closterium sp. NIES-67]|nr:hypothetical protein CLOP_g20204 [Closterium sp. NIES-67]
MHPVSLAGSVGASETARSFLATPTPSQRARRRNASRSSPQSRIQTHSVADRRVNSQIARTASPSVPALQLRSTRPRQHLAVRAAADGDVGADYPTSAEAVELAAEKPGVSGGPQEPASPSSKGSAAVEPNARAKTSSSSSGGGGSSALDKLRELLRAAEAELEKASARTVETEEEARRVAERAIELSDVVAKAEAAAEAARAQMEAELAEEALAQDALRQADVAFYQQEEALAAAEAQLQAAVGGMAEQGGQEGESLRSSLVNSVQETREELGRREAELRARREAAAGATERRIRAQGEAATLAAAAGEARARAGEAEEEVGERMGVAERAVAFELEARQSVAEAAKALARAEKLVSDIAKAEAEAAKLGAEKAALLASEVAGVSAALRATVKGGRAAAGMPTTDSDSDSDRDSTRGPDGDSDRDEGGDSGSESDREGESAKDGAARDGVAENVAEAVVKEGKGKGKKGAKVGGEEATRVDGEVGRTGAVSEGVKDARKEGKKGRVDADSVPQGRAETGAGDGIKGDAGEAGAEEVEEVPAAAAVAAAVPGSDEPAAVPPASPSSPSSKSSSSSSSSSSKKSSRFFSASFFSADGHEVQDALKWVRTGLPSLLTHLPKLLLALSVLLFGGFALRARMAHRAAVHTPPATVVQMEAVQGQGVGAAQGGVGAGEVGAALVQEGVEGAVEGFVQAGAGAAGGQLQARGRVASANPVVSAVQSVVGRVKALIDKLPRHEPNEEETQLFDVLWLLLASVVFVPIFQKLPGGSPVLGYLTAGALIGPYALSIIKHVHGTKALAEFGVVFLMFNIGLELSLERLRSMRKYVFGLGSAQVLVSALVIGLCVLAVAGVSGPAAIVIGNGLALSSTAVVLQVLQERGESTSRHGRATFSVLLFQDLAVVVLLILIPLLSPTSSKGGVGLGAIAEALGVAAVKAAVAISGIIAGGRLLLRPIYRSMAENHNAEIFAANTLLVVLGTSVLTARAGLSMALGAFLAGLLLSETEFALQVESDINPYRGLLLGLFFMTVGMSIDPKLLVARFPLILAAIAILIAGKTALLAAMGRLVGLSPVAAVRTGLLLAPGGEFAFVAFGEAVSKGIMSPQLCSLLFIVVGISMAITPWLAAVGQLIASRFDQQDVRSLQPQEAETDDLQGHIIICGFGRVGQIIGQLLSERLIPFVALDVSSDRVSAGRSLDLPVYFGDAGSRDVLHKVGAERAAAAVITLDTPGANYRAVWALSKNFPHVKTFVRAHDVDHGINLEKAGATAVVPETLEPSLQLAAAVLAQAKLPAADIAATLDDFRSRHLAELTELSALSGSSLGYGYSSNLMRARVAEAAGAAGSSSSAPATSSSSSTAVEGDGGIEGQAVAMPA